MADQVSTSPQLKADLWRSYESARSSRQEELVCSQAFSAYMKLWVESEARSVTPSPMISSSCDRYGYLKPTPAFDFPGEVWLLSNQPPGLLSSLQVHIDFLVKKLLSTDTTELETEGCDLLEGAGHVTLALSRMEGAKYNHPISSAGTEKIMDSLLALIRVLLDLLKRPLSLVNSLTTISALQWGVAFFHSIVDPQRKWQKNFMRLHSVGVVQDMVVTVPRSLSEVFITIFSSSDWKAAGLEEGGLEEGEGTWMDLNIYVLHMMGAIFFSSKSNYEPASSDRVCLLLLSLFDPREKCTAIQVMATKVFIEVLHVIHTAVAETQIGVDSAMMLVTFLNVLSPRYHDGALINPCIEMVITLLDSIPHFLDSAHYESSPGPVTESLKKLFVEVGCYEKICEVLKLVEEEARGKPEEAKQLVCGIFRAFSAVTKNCPSTRQDFEQRVAQTWLFSLITDLIIPTKHVLQEALNMVVEEKYVFTSGTHTVFNTSAMKMLFRWLPSLSGPLRVWLARRLYDMCQLGTHNRQRCCISGIIKAILEVLYTSQKPGHAFQEEVEGMLIDTVEVLGTHSIQTGELKQLIGALRPLEEGRLPTYYYRLQKSLTVMADSASEGVAPLYYFDLRTEDAYISIPGLRSFPANSSSLSFHMWVWLDSSQKSGGLLDLDMSPQETKRKRMLYSFYTNGGTGFEAFFASTGTDKDCTLVIATVTKREFITLALNEFILDKQCWYSIAIVYSVSKRPWGRSELQIYINGVLKKISVMKTPNLSDVFTSSFIGFGPSYGGTSPRNLREGTPPSSLSHGVGGAKEDQGVSSAEKGEGLVTTPIGEALWQWGSVTNLRGLVSSFCIFNDTLSSSNFMTLYRKGPNDLSLFQYKCNDTYELASKLFLYYHAKSVKKGMCRSLSPHLSIDRDNLSGIFTGQSYITWDIKAVLGSLGGVELLFPILEQVNLPVAQRQTPVDVTPTKDTPLTSDDTPTTSDGDVVPSIATPLPLDPSGKKTDVDKNSTSITPKPTSLRTKWFGENEGVAAFLKLLVAMLSNNVNNRNGFLHSEGPATVAALLMKTPPSLLTVSTFQTIQELVEVFEKEEERADLYKNLIFEFRIWSKPSYAVRIGHIQYISNIVRNMRDWGVVYGIQYILDVIRVFYSSTESASSCDAIELDNDEKKSISSALLMIIKYYLMSGLLTDELDGLLGFIAVSNDASLQEDLLRLLKNLLTQSDQGRDLGKLLWEKGTFLLSLIRAPSMPVRLITIKIVSYMMSQYMDFDGPLRVAFQDGSIAAAITHMTESNMSSAIVIALTDLCVAKETSNYTDYISNMDVFMSMLQLLREAPLNVRNTLCQLINSILHHTPEDIFRIAMVPGWEIMFCWLLTPFNPKRIAAPTKITPPPQTTPQTCPPVPHVTTPHQTSPSSKKSLPSPTTSDTEPLENGLMVQVKYRCRSSAFADGKSGDSQRCTSTSGNELTHAAPSSSPSSSSSPALLTRANSLQVSTPWTCSVEGEGDEEEVVRTGDIVTQTFRHILWFSTMNNPPWKVWGKFFSLLEEFERDNKLVLPSHILKQKLLTLFCHDVTYELKQGVDRSSTLEKLLDLTKEIEVFVISTYPDMSSTTAEDQEVFLLKLSHNFFPEINIEYYSRGLQEEYLKMLMSAGIFDKEVAFTLQEIEISQSATRILLGCLASGNREYYVTGSLRLEHMIKCPFLTMKDIYFIFSNLARVTQTALKENDSEWLQYVASILKCLFSFNYSRLKLDEHLPHLPDHRTPNFGMEFAQYCSKLEWMDYVAGQLKTAEVEYSDVLLRWLKENITRKSQARVMATRDNVARREATITTELRYQKLLVSINDLLSDELKRQESADSQLRNELSVTLQKWRSTKRFFTGERGAWSSRKPEHYLWKLDRTENFSRMRMRLARNYNYNKHEDASNLRDTGVASQAPSSKEADAHLLLKVTKRTSSSLEEDDVLLEQLWSDANSPSVREGLEDSTPSSAKERRLIKGEKCDLIMLMDHIPGSLEITSKHLYFLSDPNEKMQSQTWYSTDFKIPLSQLREIHSRRYNMSRTAFEIFLVDQTNYFINFPSKKVVNTVYRTILGLRPPNLNRVGIRKPARLLKESGLTQKWIKREISNFDYLTQLNTISGRTYNDLNQYPVFPWILTDYTSSELDLENEAVFRDLSRPVGIQNVSLEENIRIRYEEFDDPTLGKFHFGSHYSNAAGVMHYLIRIEPFTSLHIELQSGRFDFADRQFFSIPSTWANVYKTGTDQKELIPEFFYQPEFLKNINGLNLGILQTGLVLNDVVLPPWASSAEDFIIKHREALESEYVSSHLHEWIDLIFGYKQTGPEAVKACNIFNFYTYEENVNLDSIKDDKERRQVESIINNFGQTPTQLFTEPHPQRLAIDSARRTQAKGFTATFTGKRLLVNIFGNLSLLKAHSVDVCDDPIVFLGTPSIQTKALLVSGNPEQLVTVNEKGLLNIHGWLPFSNSKNRQFTFQFDPNAHFDRSRWQYIGGPFAQDIAVKPNLFVLSPNNKYLVSGGHWDNSFRVYSVEKGKLSSRITHHNDVVTCMSLDKAGLGDHLITGSRDTSCAIWKFGANGIQSHPLQTLYGHDSEVLCVGISTELDLAISGAKDGTCLLHTVRQGLYIHTLKPRKGLKCEVHLAIISSIGRLVVYTEDTTHRQRLIASVLPCLHLYTVNGLLLLEKELAECINAMVVIDKYLITGNTRGFLTFRNLFTLKQLHSLNLLQPIHCISVVLDHHHKICTHILVGLANGKLIIVSVKDIITQNKPN